MTSKAMVARKPAAAKSSPPFRVAVCAVGSLVLVEEGPGAERVLGAGWNAPGRARTHHRAWPVGLHFGSEDWAARHSERYHIRNTSRRFVANSSDAALPVFPARVA